MVYSRINFLLILLVSHFTTQITCTDEREELYQKGQHSYDTLKLSANSRTGSLCMKEAFAQLNATCAALNDEIPMAFLALKFTQCHYKSSLRAMSPACSSISKSNESITNCTKSMDNSTFLAYTQFYTYTRASCYYLEAKLWQEKTDVTITRLGDVAEESVNKIQESLTNNERLLRGQEEIYEKTTQLNQQQDSMQDKLDENHSKMDLLSKEIGDYFVMATELFSTVSGSLSRLEQMVKLVLGETQQLSSFIFYITFISATFILTFPMRTNKARMKILGATLLHFLFEKLLFTSIYSLTPEYSEHLMGLFYYTRFIMVLVSLFILLHTGYHYNDYEKLLMSIGSKLDQERIENERFREDVRNEMKLNNSSFQGKSSTFSTPPRSDSKSKQNIPTSRRSIHRVRKRLDDSSRVSSDYNTAKDPSQSSEADSVEPISFTSLDYDSGVEDCLSRKEVQLSIPKFDLSSYQHSPRSSPLHNPPLKSTPTTPYNLRARK